MKYTGRRDNDSTAHNSYCASGQRGLETSPSSAPCTRPARGLRAEARTGVAGVVGVVRVHVRLELVLGVLNVVAGEQKSHRVGPNCGPTLGL
jgi:hypothetical protein